MCCTIATVFDFGAWVFVMLCEQTWMCRPVQIRVKAHPNGVLTRATCAVLLAITALCAPHHAAADSAQLELQKKNRSKFEYHDGSAEEKRPYRRPDLDLDPTNLRVEELRERINVLEERLERLEQRSNSVGRGR
jgi:uncharacterized small protein (DUF1192 family)